MVTYSAGIKGSNKVGIIGIGLTLTLTPIIIDA